MARLIKLSGISLLCLVLIMVLLVFAWMHTYYSLTREALIAEVSFDPVDDKVYRAHLVTGDFCAVEFYEIYGDQWRVDAQFIKWKYWAALLGLDSMYRLDRLEGRYRDVEEQNQRHTMAYSIARNSAIDMVDIADALGNFNFLLDASYGSSTYHHIDPAVLYKVYKTQTGLITRTERRDRGHVDGHPLSIEITHACSDEPGIWRSLTTWLNDRLTGYR